MNRLSTLLLPALCGCAQLAPQQAVSTPAAVPTPNPSIARAPAPPPVVTLPGAICERARTGETILRVQVAADRLIERLRTDPAFGGAWYEHAPCYRLVVAFKDGQPRQWVVDAAEPELRPYIGFARSKYSKSEWEQASREIRAALATAGVEFMFFSTPHAVTVRTPAEAEIAAALIPSRYRDDTSIAVGPIEPIPERGGGSAEVLLQPQLTSEQVAQLQLQVIPLGQSVRQLRGFSEIYIKHDPTWHVVVAFTAPPPPREQIIALAPPPIRDRILVRTAKRTRAEINAALDALASALRKAGVEWGGGYDATTGRFEVKVDSPEHVERMRAAVPPELRDDTDIVVGALPVPE